MSRAYLHSRTHLFVWSICFAFLISSLFALKFLKINEKKKRNKLACASNEPFDFLLMTTFYHTHRLIFHGINMLWYYCAIGFICCEIDTLSSLDTAIYFHFEKIQKTTRVETAEWKFWQISFLWHIENPFYGTKTYLSSFCCCCFHHRRNDVKIRVRFFSSFFLVFSQNNMGWHECGS